MIIICNHCGAPAEKSTSAVNRAKREQKNIYCSRMCSGLARRKWKSESQKKREKAAYDAKRRIEKAEEIKAKKREYHRRTYDPIKAAKQRKKRMPKHIEYCRREEYRKWKKAYDRKYRAKKVYGPLADCFLLTMEIRDECLSQKSDYEIRMEKGTLNKRLKRKQNYGRLECEEPEIGPLGNLDRRS